MLHPAGAGGNKTTIFGQQTRTRPMDDVSQYPQNHDYKQQQQLQAMTKMSTEW